MQRKGKYLQTNLEHQTQEKASLWSHNILLSRKTQSNIVDVTLRKTGENSLYQVSKLPNYNGRLGPKQTTKNDKGVLFFTVVGSQRNTTDHLSN